MIPVQQAKGIFTKSYMRKYSENIPVPSFLKSFFNVSKFDSKTVSIEVERMDEYIAADVLRGTDGNRNTFSKFSEKEYMPPFFNENFDATSLDRYDRVFGSDVSFTAKTIGYLANDVSKKLLELRKKIDRAKEKMCSQVFETGIVTMVNGDSIDYNRRATSMIDLNANGGYWSVISATIEEQLVAGAEFIRTYGKSGVPEFDLVMSGTAWLALKKSNFFTTNANFNKVNLADIRRPQKTAFGSGYHGQIDAGAYTCNIWTYDEFYKSTDGVITRYWDEDYAFMVPVSGTRFEMPHAGIPAIIRDKKNAEFPEYISQQAAEYWINNYIDPKGKSHTFEVMSAPLPVPVTFDMIYTMRVLGTENPQQG